MVTAIVGANWGDEGKGKVTDVLAEQSDMVVRFQGGANAGHTIINEYGKFALHLLPSGVFHQRVVNIIGPGVALNIEALLKELHSLEERGVPAPQVKISDRCQVLLPVHIDFDRFEEELGEEAFVVATGGLSGEISRHMRKKVEHNPTLLLRGLYILYRKNGNPE